MEASYQFAGLLQVNQFENDQSDAAARDLLEAGAPLIEIADQDRYEHFRTEAIRRFAGTTNPVAAERVIRASLLAPANQATMNSLSLLAEMVAKSLAGAGSNTAPGGLDAPWKSIALALLEYRQGHWAEAADQGRAPRRTPTTTRRRLQPPGRFLPYATISLDKTKTPWPNWTKPALQSKPNSTRIWSRAAMRKATGLTGPWPEF